VGVAIGGRSFMRRLGVEKLTQTRIKKAEERMIPWKSVQRLEPELHGLHLKVQKSKVHNLHPEDIADLMEDLSPHQRILIFSTLDDSKAAQTIIGAEQTVKKEMLQGLKMRRMLDLLESIPTDQAADILSFMPTSKRNEILKKMRHDVSEKIKHILKYPSESAAAIMDTSYVAVPETYTAQQTIDYLRKKAHILEHLYHVYVLDNKKRLRGVLGLRRLLTSPANKQVRDIMRREVIHVKLHTPKENIAKTISRYDLLAVPVVDKDNVMHGIVTADDVLAEIMPEQWKREKYRAHTLEKKNGLT
jgi:Mg2+ transporter MgtE